MSPSPESDPDPFVFDHFGVVCREFSPTRESVGTVHGVTAWSEVFHDPIQKVEVQFGNSPHAPVVELIRPMEEDAPIAQVLAKKANILNHLAYRVASMDRALKRCQDLGYFAISAPAPAVAFGGNHICFLYAPAGFIIELIEGFEPSHQFVHPVTHP